MSKNFNTHIYNIPAGQDFAGSVAKQLLFEAKNQPFSLSEGVVFLPTRRACRTLREAFLRQSEGKPLMLPAMVPIGDLDSEELDLSSLGSGRDIPPAIGNSARLILLMRLILARPDNDFSLEQAAKLAAELANLIDQTHTESCDFKELEELVPEEFAAHWGITLEFLKIITKNWPLILAEEGALDAADRRNQLLRAQADEWRNNPPKRPILAAGVTGSIPAVAELLQVISSLPNGRIIIPGVDTSLDEDSWLKIGVEHPQYVLKSLISTLGLRPTEIPIWGNIEVDKNKNKDIEKLFSETMRPSETTAKWRYLKNSPLKESHFDNLRFITAATPEEESLAIALIMRGALESPTKRAALITPDRELAARTAGHLSRWGIEIDDSAGQSLAKSRIGRYLRLCLNAVSEDFAPLPLLSLLKHPLAKGGMKKQEFHDLIRKIELLALRGAAPIIGIEDIKIALDNALKDKYKIRKINLDNPEKQVENIHKWLEYFKEISLPLKDCFAAESINSSKILEALISFAEKLAHNEDKKGADALWCREDGKAAAALLAQLTETLEDLGDIKPKEFPAVFDVFLGEALLRPKWGLHPRLHILGPMEARLQHFDVTILGSLNEGTWPNEIKAGPWMSRPMQAKFGLPAPEMRLGLSAHDFVQTASSYVGNNIVYLTRAQKISSAPSLPSRWLSRMDTVLRAMNIEPEILEDNRWVTWARELDAAEEQKPLPRPMPCPPVSARPQRLSISDIELLRRDPYSLYAKKILRLLPLDDISAEYGVAERGTFIHNALDDFMKQYPKKLPSSKEEALEILLDCGKDAFGDALLRPEVKSFWWPRFETIAKWIIKEEYERRPQIHPVGLEINAEWHFNLPDSTPFTLVGKADRIDIDKKGRYQIIDYKTGEPPKKADILSGHAPQLPLESIMLQEGAFENLPMGETDKIAYWHLKGLDETQKIIDFKTIDIPELLENTAEKLPQWLQSYRDESSTYPAIPDPKYAPKYNDYNHLSRQKEWSVAEEK